MNKYCPRCAHYSVETLKTHSHCLNCNFSPDCDGVRQNDDVVPNWVVSYLNSISPRSRNRLGAKRLLANAAILFCLIITSGCLAKKDETITQQIQPTLSPRIEYFGLETLIEAFPDFNRYGVKVSWPGDYPGDSWVLSRQNKNETQELAKLPKEKNWYEDVVKGGELYTYFLSSIERDKIKIIGERNVTIPIDYLIDGNTFPSDLKNINRVFVPKGAILRSHGKDLKWTVNEVLAGDFVIDTSPDWRKLKPGENGDSCSSIEIKTKKIKGSLSVECTPQNGADGADGLNGKHGEPGKKGLAGDVELKPRSEWKSPLNDYQIANMKNWYVGGQLPNGNKPDRFTWDLWFRCSQAPTKGGDGEHGEHGQDGGVGGNGGNSSRMVFQADSYRDFQLSYSTHSGKPGLGGRGGHGGKGGAGGPPGDADPSGFLCPVSTEFGKNGGTGLTGRNGKEGLNGLKWVAKWIYKGGGTCGGHCK